MQLARLSVSVEVISSGIKEDLQYNNRPLQRQGVAKMPSYLDAHLEDGIQNLLESVQELSPTVFSKRGFRFAFFSNEEPRMHVHVHRANGQAKFWLEPTVELAENKGLRSGELTRARHLTEEHYNEIRRRWERHFGS